MEKEMTIKWVVRIHRDYCTDIVRLFDYGDFKSALDFMGKMLRSQFASRADIQLVRMNKDE